MRSTRVRYRVLGSLAVLSLLAGACGGDDEDGAAPGAVETTAPTETAGTTPDNGDEPADTAAGDVEIDTSAEFGFANSFGHNSFDPHRSPNAPADAAFLRPVYDSLVTLEVTPESVEVAPQLATSWEVSDDGLSVEFVLRDDVVFQDGNPFNAKAVRANIERAKDPKSTVSSLLDAVDSVEAVDDTHVVFHLSRRYPALLYSLAADTIGMMVSPAAFETDLATAPVGSGPFELVSARKDAEVVYRRWDGYWDEDAAQVAQLTIFTVPEANARFNAVRTGEYDVAYMAPPLDRESRELQSQGFHWVQELAPITIGVVMNTTMEPFDDVRVRRAVSMAMNRQLISDELFGGLQPPVYQPFVEGYLGHDPELDVEPYDPDAARALIQEAGAEGATVNILANSVPPYDSVAQVAQQALSEIGLNAQLHPVSPSTWREEWRKGGYPAGVGTILGEPEPSLTLDASYLNGENLGEPPPELAEMANEAMTLPSGSDEREAAYQEISRFLVENPIHVPVVQFSTVVLARPRVVGAETMVPVVIGNLDFRNVATTAS